MSAAAAAEEHFKGVVVAESFEDVCEDIIDVESPKDVFLAVALVEAAGSELVVLAAFGIVA